MDDIYDDRQFEQQYDLPFGQQFGDTYGQTFGDTYGPPFGGAYGQPFGVSYGPPFGSPFGAGFPGSPPGPPPFTDGGQTQGPPGPPPSFTPAQQPVGVYAVDPGSIRRCRYRYTYIWLTNRRSFWAWLTFVGRTSVAGWRWTGFSWVYFGTDLNNISSFTCFG